LTARKCPVVNVPQMKRYDLFVHSFSVSEIKGRVTVEMAAIRASRPGSIFLWFCFHGEWKIRKPSARSRQENVIYLFIYFLRNRHPFFFCFSRKCRTQLYNVPNSITKEVKETNRIRAESKSVEHKKKATRYAKWNRFKLFFLPFPGKKKKKETPLPRKKTSQLGVTGQFSCGKRLVYYTVVPGSRHPLLALRTNNGGEGTHTHTHHATCFNIELPATALLGKKKKSKRSDTCVSRVCFIYAITRERERTGWRDWVVHNISHVTEHTPKKIMSLFQQREFELARFFFFRRNESNVIFSLCLKKKNLWPGLYNTHI